MSDIRFVHTDYWRLADSIAGLATAPEWLRRQARDATRDSVLATLNLASTRNADFIFVGGSCTDDKMFYASVADWLREPLNMLRRQGIRVVMAESHLPAINELADVIVRPNERVHASRTDGTVRLTTANAHEDFRCDLAISTGDCGPSANATCNYLYSPQLRHEIAHAQHRNPVYSAGATQAHSPAETGEFGCLLVAATASHHDVTTSFHSTDTLRFDKRTIDGMTAHNRQRICDEIVEESRVLARQVSLTTVVDWQITSPLDGVRTLELLRSDEILDLVRADLQTGHLGVWPRRVAVFPANLQMATQSNDIRPDTLRTLLFDEATATGSGSQAGFEQLVTGARLLNRAA
jgi:hypothetical protein